MEMLTWREIKEIADRLAKALADLGIIKGQKLALMNALYLEKICLYIAVRKAGAIFIPERYAGRL